MSNTEKKLALCPFCGNNVGNNIIYNKDTKKWWIECDDCDCKNHNFDTEEEAIELLKARTEPPKHTVNMEQLILDSIVLLAEKSIIWRWEGDLAIGCVHEDKYQEAVEDIFNHILSKLQPDGRIEKALERLSDLNNVIDSMITIDSDKTHDPVRKWTEAHNLCSIIKQTLKGDVDE